MTVCGILVYTQFSSDRVLSHILLNRIRSVLITIFNFLINLVTADFVLYDFLTTNSKATNFRCIKLFSRSLQRTIRYQWVSELHVGHLCAKFQVSTTKQFGLSLIDILKFEPLFYPFWGLKIFSTCFLTFNRQNQVAYWPLVIQNFN